MAITIADQMACVEGNIKVLEDMAGDPEIDATAHAREIEVWRAILDTLTDVAVCRLEHQPRHEAR